MKTKEQIIDLKNESIKEFNALMEQNKDNHKKLRLLKLKFNKEVDFYNNCILYIESNPTVEFVDRQINSVKKRIDNIEWEFKKSYDLAKNKEQLIKMKTSFCNEYGMKNLKLQLKYLNFLID